VEFVQPLVQRVDRLHIPAKIVVVSQYVGKSVERGVGFCHRYLRAGGRARRVERVGDIVQSVKTREQFFVALAGHCYLVFYAPAEYGRMIDILFYKRGKLFFRVLLARFRVYRDDGDFRPDQHTFLVAERIELFRLLVVREAY